MKMHFMVLLYTEMKLVNRSKYRVVKTRANIIWDLPDKP